MVSGEKLMKPCSDCDNPKGCLSRGMQYKETEEKMDEQAALKVSSDGSVVSCAKGEVSACGYKGGSVCGACGAPALKLKGQAMMEDGEEEMMEDGEEEMISPVKKSSRKKGGMMMDAEMSEDEDEEYKPSKSKKGGMMMDAQMSEDEDEEYKPSKSKKRSMPMMADDDEDMMDDEEDEMDDEEDEMDEEDEDEAEEEAMTSERLRMRNRRMATMGIKSADYDEEAFVCSFDRKVYPGASGVCENCPGGCAPEGNLPGLLEVEGIAEDMFLGKVLDSGYSDEADLYVIDVERKDGRVIEAFFEGTSSDCLGWHLLENDPMAQKSIEDHSNEIVTFSEAAEIAVKAINGNVLGVDPDIFEGFDSYAVEIEGKDGKSYDVYVSLDGEVLGYDEYSAQEAEEIEAEAAEIALKRAYSEEARGELASKGMAMPDGSFPIKDEADLRNAIQAYGRAKDKEAAKAHIIKRAMNLGREDLIPMNWVPKKVQEEFSEGMKKDASDEFLANLMEFELFTAEEDSRELFNND
jgi:hypothetical protein